jgi:hypothetical protein
MATPEDPTLEQQRLELAAQIEQLKQQIFEAQNAGEEAKALELQTQLVVLEDKLRAIQSDADSKAAQKAARDARKGYRVRTRW